SLGQDPSFVVGAEMAGPGTNAHLGADPLMVLEVDEAFRTFESVHLVGLVVTNVEVDHLDHFGTEDDLAKAFTAVTSAVDGPVVCCADDPGAAAVVTAAGARTDGISEGVDCLISDVQTDASGSMFTLTGPAGSVMAQVPGPGLRLVRNAAGAISLLAELGTPLEGRGRALVPLLGVARRFVILGTVGVVDSYGEYL